MTTEEFLRDICPNHTEKSRWNKSELLHILEAYKDAINGQSEQSSKIVDGECMMCGDVADTKEGWICDDCRKL